MFYLDGQKIRQQAKGSPTSDSREPLDWATLGARVREAAHLAVAEHLAEQAAQVVAKVNARSGDGSPPGLPLTLSGSSRL